MVNRYKYKNTFKLQVITIAVLAFAIFLLMVLAGYPWFIERCYTESFYLFICHLLHPVLNLLPFSAGDVLYLTLIVYIFYALFWLIKLSVKKQFRQVGIFLLKLVIGIQTGVLIFYLFWGMNYFRPPAAERLNLRDSSYTTASLEAVTAMLIDSANACRTRLTPADLLQNNGVIYQAAVQAIGKLSNSSVNFRTYRPAIKASILTPLLNYMGTSGYYNPFTGEAQINYQIPVFNRPAVACHEMAHQMGYGPEDEADFIAFVAAARSRNRLLRYSAYYLAVGEFMQALRLRDSVLSKALKPRIAASVLNDFKAERKYWLFYQSKIDVLSSFFYDKFLKANNQPQGLDTYNRMVLLVMALYKVHSR